MSVAGGPRIDNSQLALCLDTTNSKSYPGSGTVWTDLAQGLTFDSSGTLNSYEYRDGVPCLHFNNSGYWRCSTDYSLVDLAGDCTVEFWLWAEDNVERDGLFEKAGNTYASYEQELACTFEPSETLTYYSRQGGYSFGTSLAFDLGSWSQISIKLSSGKTATARTAFRSKNGSAWVSNWTSRSSNAIVPAGNITVGYGYAGPMESSYIAIVRVYHKMLSDAEILDNYNVTKERFGL